MSRAALIANAVLSVALLGGYVLLTVLNHDATALLGALVGQLGAVGTAHAADTANRGGAA